MFIDIENKENSAAKMAAVAGQPTKYYLFAQELNTMVSAINSLRHLISLNAGNIQILLSTAPKIELGIIVGDFVDEINAMEELVIPSPVFITFTNADIFYVYAFAGEANTYGTLNGLFVTAEDFLPVYQSDEQGAPILQNFQSVMEAGSEWIIDAYNYFKFHGEVGNTYKDYRAAGFGWRIAELFSSSGWFANYHTANPEDGDVPSKFGSIGMQDSPGEFPDLDLDYGPFLQKQKGFDAIRLSLEHPEPGSGTNNVVIPNTQGQKRRLATEHYVNELIEGLKTKQPVRFATTENITLSGLQTIDGGTTLEDDRVLVKDNIDQTKNGLYFAKSGAWERASDANTATELTNAVVSVLEGTTNGQATFRQITTSIVLDTSNIVWQSFGSSVPDATSSTKGKAKLYTSLGTNTDGAVDQNTVNAALNKLENYFISKQNGTFGSHTGDLLETVLSSDNVVGGFFVAGDTMALPITFQKETTLANVTFRVRFGTTGTTADTLVATYGPINQRAVNFDRSFISFLSGNLVRVTAPSSSLISDNIGTSGVFAGESLTYSADWKITITAQLGNAADAVSIKTMKASKTKSI